MTLSLSTDLTGITLPPVANTFHIRFLRPFPRIDTIRELYHTIVEQKFTCHTLSIIDLADEAPPRIINPELSALIGRIIKALPNLESLSLELDFRREGLEQLFAELHDHPSLSHLSFPLLFRAPFLGVESADLFRRLICSLPRLQSLVLRGDVALSEAIVPISLGFQAQQKRYGLVGRIATVSVAWSFAHPDIAQWRYDDQFLQTKLEGIHRLFQTVHDCFREKEKCHFDKNKGTRVWVDFLDKNPQLKAVSLSGRHLTPACQLGLVRAFADHQSLEEVQFHLCEGTYRPGKLLTFDQQFKLIRSLIVSRPLKRLTLELVLNTHEGPRVLLNALARFLQSLPTNLAVEIELQIKFCQTIKAEEPPFRISDVGNDKRLVVLNETDIAELCAALPRSPVSSIRCTHQLSIGAANRLAESLMQCSRLKALQLLIFKKSDQTVHDGIDPFDPPYELFSHPTLESFDLSLMDVPDMDNGDPGHGDYFEPNFLIIAGSLSENSMLHHFTVNGHPPDDDDILEHLNFSGAIARLRKPQNHLATTLIQDILFLHSQMAKQLDGKKKKAVEAVLNNRNSDSERVQFAAANFVLLHGQEKTVGIDILWQILHNTPDENLFREVLDALHEYVRFVTKLQADDILRVLVHASFITQGSACRLVLQLFVRFPDLGEKYKNAGNIGILDAYCIAEALTEMASIKKDRERWWLNRLFAFANIFDSQSGKRLPGGDIRELFVVFQEPALKKLLKINERKFTSLLFETYFPGIHSFLVGKQIPHCIETIDLLLSLAELYLKEADHFSLIKEHVKVLQETILKANSEYANEVLLPKIERLLSQITRKYTRLEEILITYLSSILKRKRDERESQRNVSARLDSSDTGFTFP